MAYCLTAAADRRPIDVSAAPTTILRWSFRRGQRVIVCELGLDRSESAYEVTTAVPWTRRPLTEYFADATSALQRQAAVERMLIGEGWSREGFVRAERITD